MVQCSAFSGLCQDEEKEFEKTKTNAGLRLEIRSTKHEIRNRTKGWQFTERDLKKQSQFTKGQNDVKLV
jgi:hypothetical protein